MILRTKNEATAVSTENNTATRPRHDGPAGAPKASNVKEVLLTLRSRLGVQLETADDNDPVMARALHDNIRGQLEQINEALTRIEHGKYGVCANCVKPIEADRLVVRPYSTLCLGCQNSRDRGKLAR
jgi:RNA polymerase-binding transcription factor DksA